MKAKVTITPRRGVLDPQGRAVLGSLHSLGYSEVTDVRVGRCIELELDPLAGPDGLPVDASAMEGRLEEMCRRLLANTLIEDYRFEIESVTP
jgi:phosphoribosylformylglycinamidine synthase